jgi:MarR family transcriptional regulator, transcriptional regulator for hemolysin
MRAVADASPFRHAEADDSPGFLLWKITALWQRTLAAVLGDFGITQTQYAILASLRWFEERDEPATQAHLAEHAKLDKMTLSKAIRRLEEDGLVKRAQSSSDGRATQVRFTAKGRKITEAAIVAIEGADEVFFSTLSARELAMYKALIVGLVAANS